MIVLCISLNIIISIKNLLLIQDKHSHKNSPPQKKVISKHLTQILILFSYNITVNKICKGFNIYFSLKSTPLLTQLSLMNIT